ncbi:hypothetical protein POREN0001_0691 [Porphyromonas endodontalis ATCC 35406]|uniref:Uncharacterized protein n=1 Tax=Porphyromonas endodontalis (strain ATCC 35406 / DSM 24491 / JCM 8526 / CCUG 16442 / BCRC 14492 / NCTC 13058 / HG 370) TaxID=553175 RepID=C3JD05_POREA|nr:hypothetical protein POREN0001_0691 [Porphyromonas endodontalis ATCC 35406]
METIYSPPLCTVFFISFFVLCLALFFSFCHVLSLKEKSGQDGSIFFSLLLYYITTFYSMTLLSLSPFL